MRNEVIFDNRGIPDIMVVFTPDELGLPAEIRGKAVKEYAISKYEAPQEIKDAIKANAEKLERKEAMTKAWALRKEMDETIGRLRLYLEWEANVLNPEKVQRYAVGKCEAENFTMEMIQNVHKMIGKLHKRIRELADELSREGAADHE